MAGENGHETRPVGELLKELSQQTATLVHQEVELAKAELSQKGRMAGAGAGLFGVSGAIGLGALGALTACLILALAAIVPAWLAALIVALAYGAIAAMVMQQGRQKMRNAAPPVPQQTIETVKEDMQWAKNQARSAER